MSDLTPQMRHQRKAVLKLVLLSLSIFLVSLWGVKEEEPVQTHKGTATMKAPPRSPKAETPRTWSPGSRSAVPLVRSEGAAGDAAAGVATVASVTPAVRDCLVQWWMMDPALEGDVRIALTSGPTGLVSAAVLDHEGAPEAAVGCLGEALGGDWAASATEGVTIVSIPVFEKSAGSQ